MYRCLVIGLIVGVGAVAHADPPGPLDPDCVDEVAAALAPAPRGRRIASLTRQECAALLTARGVRFEVLPEAQAEGVDMPIRLRGPLGGVVVENRGHSELHEIIDCRLAVALLEWSPTLREAGFTTLRHYSVYRPGARVARSGRPSGHANALAIDVGLLERDGDAPIEVLSGWEARERGAAPCARYEESDDSALLRQVVCRAVEADLFQVVLTPHHDHAHRNHVHLEIRPDVEWSYVH